MVVSRAYLMVGASVAALLASPEAAAAQTSPQAPGTAAGAQDTGGEIVVSGIRRSLESAQQLKRNSDDIVDSIVAEDIGKLPDVSAAESLARITGVQVDRNAAAAQNVRLRGLVQIATTYNGREMFTGDGRSVALQDFPSDTIARIDVYKSGSADLVEPGLAGLIDIRSRRPFDFKTTTLSGAVSGIHWYQSQQLGVEASGLFSTRWHTGIGEMGFLIEGSYADTKFQDPSRVVNESILNRTNIPGYVGEAIRYPSAINTNYSTGIRWRPNADASFQWRPSSTLEIYVDGLFQGYRAHNGARNFLVNSGAAATLSNIILFPGTNEIKSVDATAGGQATSGQQVNEQLTNSFQGGGGFIWNNGKLKINGDVAYTHSEFTNTAYTFNYTSIKQPTRHFDFDSADGAGGGTVTVSNFDIINPASYNWTNITESGSKTSGQSVQSRLDLDYKLGGILTNLQAGLRYSSRSATSFSYTQTDLAPTGTPLTKLPLNYVVGPDGLRGDEADTIKVWMSPTRDSLVANIDALRTLAGAKAPTWGSPVYTSQEGTYTGYVQARYAMNLGVPVDGLIGVRATRTDDTLNGTQSVTSGGVTTIQPLSKSNSYTDFLPNVSMRLKFTPKVQLRLAYTKTRTRPAFSDLSPSITVSAAGTCSSDPSIQCSPATGGNPDLKPVQSTNYDTSLEWYFSRNGAITVGAFYKDLNGFVNTTTTVVDDPTYGRLQLSRPENGGHGRIKGVEAAARTFFRAPWLPNWVGNFGALANFTYLDAKSELSPTLAATLPGLQPISGISKYLYNVSGFYDNNIVSARLSYNFASSYILSYDQIADPALGTNVLSPTLPTTSKGRGTMDFAATLAPNKHVSFTFNATNLLGAAVRTYRQYNAQGQVYPYQTTLLESVYRVGVRFRF